MSRRTQVLTAVGATIAALAAPAAAQAATYTVSADGGACGGGDTSCGSLVAAAGAAGGGDSVQVSPGAYTESPNFAAGVTVTGSTTAPGVVVSGTIAFAGNGAQPGVLEKLVVSATGPGQAAVSVSGSAGVTVRDALVLSTAGPAIVITGGQGNALTRATAISAAGTAVDVQVSTTGVTLALDSSVLSGGGSASGLSVKTGAGTIVVPGQSAPATVTARHVTIAGSANAIVLDSRSATGLLNSGAGSIQATVSDSIVLGSNATLPNPGTPLLAASNTATLAFTRTDQATPAEQLFVNAAKRNFHLRADAVAIDKAQVTAGSSPTDIDGQPRTAGAASDQGADEFHNTAPTAAFAVKTVNPRAGQPIDFDASASVDREAGFGGGIVQYQWNFGDGQTETTSTPTVKHAYGGEGDVVVTLVVLDRQGASSAAASVPVKLTDGTPPAVVITKPFRSQKIKLITTKTKTVIRNGKKTTVRTRSRTRIKFAGTAKDKSGVTAVVLTIQKLDAKPETGAKAKCTWLDPRKGLLRRACSKPVFIRVRFKDGAWAYNVGKAIKLSAGRYEVRAGGTDGAGAAGNSAPPRDRAIRFKLA